MIKYGKTRIPFGMHRSVANVMIHPFLHPVRIHPQWDAGYGEHVAFYRAMHPTGCENCTGYS